VTTVKLWNVQGREYTLTTDHPSSSHGIPVLLDSNRSPFGPGDVIGVGQTAGHARDVVGNWAKWARDMLSPGEQEFIAKFTDAG
jgi:hypothetical protein